MRGLPLSEAFYRTLGRRMIENEFPGHKHRIAVGLVGMGSECFGFDDALSRDHDWGPAFCMWLDRTDFDTIGPDLQKAYESLPSSFLGFERKTSPWGRGRTGVMEITAFYASFIGTMQPPQSFDHWLAIPESNLAACTNGKVFHDPLGRFSLIRKTIRDYYPEDIRLKKIAAKCMAAAQSGQYNYWRCIMRQSPYPAQYAMLNFCENVLGLVFLLNSRYMPFYKWAWQAASRLPGPGSRIAQAVEALIGSDDPRLKMQTIEKICALIIEALHTHGLSHCESRFLLDHGPIVHSRIKNPELRQIDIWWGGH